MQTYLSYGGEYLHIVKEGDKYILKYKLGDEVLELKQNLTITKDTYADTKELFNELIETQKIRKHFSLGIRKINKFEVPIEIVNGCIKVLNSECKGYKETFLKANTGKKGIIKIELMEE